MPSTDDQYAWLVTAHGDEHVPLLNGGDGEDGAEELMN